MLIDQILIVLKDCATKDSSRIATKILNIIRNETLTKNGEEIGITVSIGVAQMLSDDNTETLISRAETGVYSARDIGRNTYAIGYDWVLIDYSCEPIF